MALYNDLQIQFKPTQTRELCLTQFLHFLCQFWRPQIPLLLRTLDIKGSEANDLIDRHDLLPATIYGIKVVREAQPCYVMLSQDENARYLLIRSSCDGNTPLILKGFN